VEKLKNKISVVIITNNEEDNILDLLHNISWADEVIIVDSLSTDRTVALAVDAGAKVFQKEFEGFGNQKNYAIAQAANQWILLLDADERVSEALKNSIIHHIGFGTEIDAFYISRINYFLEKRIHFSGWQNDKIVRLIKKSKCKYNLNPVHESIIIDGLKTALLEGELEHYTYKSLSQFKSKQITYARIAAKELFEKNKKGSYFQLIFKPIFRFIKHYFLQLGILDGKAGFLISIIMAYTVYLRFHFLKELNKKKL
jgi:glycosyltransferase involved in cell wall biosynthesis